MLTILTAGVFVLALAGGQGSRPPGALNPDILISDLSPAEIERALATGDAIAHRTEVSPTASVTVVITAEGCDKATLVCGLTADVVVFRPDDTVLQEVKALELPKGRAVVRLRFDDEPSPGVYRVSARIRDLETRRFGSVERKFGVR